MFFFVHVIHVTGYVRILFMGKCSCINYKHQLHPDNVKLVEYDLIKIIYFVNYTIVLIISTVQNYNNTVLVRYYVRHKTAVTSISQETMGTDRKRYKNNSEIQDPLIDWLLRFFLIYNILESIYFIAYFIMWHGRVSHGYRDLPPVTSLCLGTVRLTIGTSDRSKEQSFENDEKRKRSRTVSRSLGLSVFSRFYRRRGTFCVLLDY